MNYVIGAVAVVIGACYFWMSFPGSDTPSQALSILLIWIGFVNIFLDHIMEQRAKKED